MAQTRARTVVRLYFFIRAEEEKVKMREGIKQQSHNTAQARTRKSEPLPADLRNAETILAELASVFSFTDTGNENSTYTTTTALPGVTDFYRILVEQIPAVVFIAFFENGMGEAYVSPQIEASLGFTQEEWLGDPVRWFHQIHPEDRARWSSEAAQMFVTGEPLRSVYRVMARDGRVVWFHCEVKLVRHADGHPWFIHGIGFDITELKQTEEALTKSEEMLRGIFEYAPDTMIVVDDKGHITSLNEQVERMFDYSREELFGQPIEILIPDRFRRQHINHRADYGADPHLRPMGVGLKLYGRRKDGTEFPVEIMLSPLKTESTSPVIAVIRDITRRQRDEEALREYAERMKDLSRRLIEVQESERRSIALELHDQIGQILTGLKLKLEMLPRLSAEEAQDSLSEAQTLVNQLLTRTRKLSLDLRPATLDYLGLLSALLRHFRQYTSQTGLRVEFNHSGLEGQRFAPELETTVFRIVQEGLTNIARHAGATEATVQIWANINSLAVEIADNGKGFDVDTTLADGQSNGLTGMRERVSLLGGQFRIESHLGIGTRLIAEWNLDDNSDLNQNG
jgi:PAS domain S-box-containing protein